jgi:hypothetical protein
MTSDFEDVIDYEVDMQIPLKNINMYTTEWLDWDLDTRDRNNSSKARIHHQP